MTSFDTFSINVLKTRWWVFTQIVSFYAIFFVYDHSDCLSFLPLCIYLLDFEFVVEWPACIDG
ncbi:MAG: hypothetical protein DBW84_07390 [Synechococcus sp. MED-G70]|nr:MAG: hypothetical protein DBW84_07390 [Synechococcus sp. MED-G70]